MAELSRRAVVGGAAIASLGLLGLDVALFPDAARATTPGATPAEAAAIAVSLVGKTKAQLASVIVDVPWNSYSGAWCAWFGSWILRGAGIPYLTLASALRDRGDVIAPGDAAAGDIVYYPPQPAAPDGHVGVVVGRSGNNINVVEGNAGDAPGVVTSRANPFGTFIITRPPWPAAPDQRKFSVTTRYAQLNTGSPQGGHGTLIALAGDAGYPCPGNWLQYTRDTSNGTLADRALQEYKVHGEPVWVDVTTWNTLKKAYTEGGPSITSPTISLSPDDRALLVDIANKLTALQ